MAQTRPSLPLAVASRGRPGSVMRREPETACPMLLPAGADQEQFVAFSHSLVSIRTKKEERPRRPATVQPLPLRRSCGPEAVCGMPQATPAQQSSPCPHCAVADQKSHARPHQRGHAMGDHGVLRHLGTYRTVSPCLSHVAHTALFALTLSHTHARARTRRSMCRPTRVL